MEDRLLNLQEKMRQNFNVLTLVLVLAEIVFIIIMIISFRNVLTSKEDVPKIQIESMYSKISGLSEQSQDIITHNIYNAVALNSKELTNVADSGAVIRDGSVINRYFENINMHYVNFIVDIPSVSQSYQIFHEYTDDNNNRYFMPNNSTMVMCLPKDKLIYEDFNCKDNSNGYAKYAIVDSFDVVSDVFKNYNVVTIGDSNDSAAPQAYVAITAYSCNNDAPAVEQSVDNWFKSLGFSLNEFNYETEIICSR